MPRRSQKKPNTPPFQLTWSPDTELIGLEFELVPAKDCYLFPQYIIGLHAWFLEQVRSNTQNFQLTFMMESQRNLLLSPL